MFCRSLEDKKAQVELRTEGDPFQLLDDLRAAPGNINYSKVKKGFDRARVYMDSDLEDLNDIRFWEHEQYKESLKLVKRSSEDIKEQKEANREKQLYKGWDNYAWADVTEFGIYKDYLRINEGRIYYRIIDNKGHRGYFCQHFKQTELKRFWSIVKRWSLQKGGHLLPVYWNNYMATFRVDTRKKPLVCEAEELKFKALKKAKVTGGLLE